MSTTLDRSIAEKYSKGNAENPSLILEMEMGMVNRGAFLGWISQYPEECEILLPPLTGLEVSDYTTNADGTLVYTMQLNINMQSMTIEQVLALRQKQCLELAEVVKRDLASHAAVGDIPQRQSAADVVRHRIEVEPDTNVFNDNGRFVQATEATLAQLPRQGDEMVSLDKVHTGTVVCLAAGCTGAPPLISGGLDGAMVLHGSAERLKPVKFSNQEHTGLPTPVLCVEMMHPLPCAAVGLFDHTVRIAELTSQSERQRLVGHAGPVTALAWDPKACWLASGSSTGEICAWELDSMQAHANPTMMEQCKCVLTGHTDAVRSLVWLKDGLLASGSLDGTVRIVRVEKKAHSNALGGEFVQLLERHNGPVTALATASKPENASRASEHNSQAAGVLVTASADRSMCVWDSTTFELVTEVLKCHDLGICALAALTKHHQIATASADATIKTWRLLPNNAVEQMLTMQGHVGAVHSLCYIESRGWLASGGTDNTIRLWRVGGAGGSAPPEDDAPSLEVQRAATQARSEQQPQVPCEAEPWKTPCTKPAQSPMTSETTPMQARKTQQKDREPATILSSHDSVSDVGRSSHILKEKTSDLPSTERVTNKDDAMRQESLQSKLGKEDLGHTELVTRSTTPTRARKGRKPPPSLHDISPHVLQLSPHVAERVQNMKKMVE